MKQIIFAAAILIGLSWPAQGALIINNDTLATASSSLQVYLNNAPFTTSSAPISHATVDRATLKDAVIAGNYTSRLPDATRNGCPSSCSSAGIDSTEWYIYHSINRLGLCNSTMLLDFALFNQLDDAESHISIAACTADLQSSGSATSTATNATCQSPQTNQTRVTSTLQFTSSGSSSSNEVTDVVNALQQLQTYSALSGVSCNESIHFAYSGTTAIGVYVGSGLASQSVIGSVLSDLASQVKSADGVSENMLIQLCEERSARYSLGIVVNTKGDLSFAQLSVQTWRNNSCVTGTGGTSSAWNDLAFLAPSISNTETNTTTGNLTMLTERSKSPGHRQKLSARDTCSTIQVASGDTCTTLASECGITAAEFTEYNPSSTECSTLAVGEYVCCSDGTLPDNTPSPDSDGNCYSHLIVTGDSCSALAASYDITVDDIDDYNKDTWGWNGCSDLYIGNYICLSSGYPPMPTTLANAVCGPQVNGTATAPHGTDLTQLNKCPLNACCDIWGQCGTTFEFCTISNSTTGAPGTAAAGQNGCISNCGTTIIASDPPNETFSIAYFEGFDWTRPCLTMSVTDIDTSVYTHIHFAFATLNTDYSLNISTIETQLPFLKAMTGVKRVISIGGWDFSADPSTYMIFRDLVASDENRATVISNVIDFLNEYDLDGVDWDWEYPDESDIPGILVGSAEDSTGYFLLLDELQTSIAANAPGKTVSITAPASYWYLQWFPILAISAVVDYIVLMTYDLHGQWDYTNVNADDGCPGGGNCLRSHVNLTETISGLSMITKAGVPSNMIAVGVSSYGRSFEMTTAGCWTSQCSYVGPDSGALPGLCTNTAGYIADYELDLIIAENPTAEIYWDDDSYSNILVYNETQWAAYMNDSNKLVRKLMYEGLAFLGISDWAVDLQSEGSGATSSSSSSGSSANETVYVDPDIWNSASPVVTALPGVTLVWPPMPLGSTTTITFPLLTTTVSYSSLATLTSTLTDGSLSTYPWYVYEPVVTVVTVPPVTTTAIPVWGISLDADATTGTFFLTSSVQPEPFAITVTPVMNGTTSIIGATTTSTSSGGIVVWGDYTYQEPSQTETEGSSTTIIGGTTLAPKVMTITPNPYPTTVPSTVDPKINSRTPVWTSGKPMKPTNLPGCDGCGLPCLLFCDSDCPFCPPYVFYNDNGNGENDDTSSTRSDSSSSSSTVYTETVLYATDGGDSFDGTFASYDDMTSIMVADESIWYADYVATASTTSITPTSASVRTTTIPDVTVTVTPTPSADCALWDSGLAYQLEIYNIVGWSYDGGSALKTQESGCGALTGWDYVDATDSSYAYVHFYLPIIIKAGCVERAIVSAGGPKISCVGMGVADKRSLELNAGSPVLRKYLGTRTSSAANAVASPLPITEDVRALLISVYGDSTIASHSPYVPMIWSTANGASITSS